jgi:hypothetical protein
MTNEMENNRGALGRRDAILGPGGRFQQLAA